MNELISIAIFIATLFGGTIVAEKILINVRGAALSKSAQGLPRLSPFAQSLTHGSKLRKVMPRFNEASPEKRKAIYQ